MGLDANDFFIIEIVERYLPQGLEAWNAVADQYQRESNKLTLS